MVYRKKQIIKRLIIEYKFISKRDGYYIKENEKSLNDKLEKSTGVYEMALKYQPYTGCGMTKIIDELIIPTMSKNNI